MEEIDGRLAVTDVDSRGNRFVKFWIDGPLIGPTEEQSTPRGEEPTVSRIGPSQCMVPPFPFATERHGEPSPRAPRTPDREPNQGRAGQLPGQGRRVGFGSPGFGGGGVSEYLDEGEEQMGHTPGRCVVQC